MVTLHLDAVHDPAASVMKAALLLRNGLLVAIPTETVYGLAACISNEGALANVFAAKRRPVDNPLIVHIANRADVYLIAHVDALSEHLIDKFWPGALTLVLAKKKGVSELVTAGLDTVAVRMPSLGITRDIIAAAGEPLAAPSANISGRPSATTAQHVIDDFGGSIAAVVDAGACEQGIESTVIRVVDGRVMLLRPGGITRQQIESVIGSELLSPEAQDARTSPGTRHRHYAPHAAVVLCDTEDMLRSEAVPGTIVLSKDPPPIEIPWRRLDATTLFAELRRADDLQVNKILVHCTHAVRIDEALMNRLRMAAEPFRESDVGK